MISVKFLNVSSRILCLALIGLFCGSTNLKSQEIKSIKQSEWKGYVREFRGSHNFSLVGGRGQSLWTINHGSDDIRQESSSVYSKLQYAFHIPLWRGFGYFLGSSIGTILNHSDSNEPMESGPTYMLPGILAGGVINFSPEFRVGAGVDYYMERVSSLEWRGASDTYPNRLDMTMVSLLDVLAFMDLFYTINMSIRIEYHKRNMEYSKPSSQYKDKVVDAKINRKDSWIGLGLAYHLL